MFGHTFYHKTLRKYVTLFGTLFNDVYINRANSAGVDVETLKVPIYYGPKQKTLERLDSDPLLNRPAEAILPRMAFEMTGMQYDPSRKLTTASRGFIKENPNGGVKYAFNPVPYNIDFSLYIMVKNAEDGTRILEQILPFFTPEWTSTVNLISDVDAKLDIPVIIGSVSSEDTYEGGAAERRTIIWTLSFTLKGYIFGPVRKAGADGSGGGGIIKLAKTNFFASLNSNTTGEYSHIYPGLTANGTPTTDPAATVDYTLIDEGDDWAYIVERGYIRNE